MQIDINKVKIVVTVPTNYTEKVRTAICEAGAGVIGNYTYCSTAIKSIGTFIPTNKANPFIGESNKLEYVEEDKLEVVCNINEAKKVLKRLRDVHPYEEPRIDIIPLIDEKDL